jgi:hypothetical protein
MIFNDGRQTIKSYANIVANGWEHLLVNRKMVCFTYKSTKKYLKSGVFSHFSENKRDEYYNAKVL